jgi:hypothetical protein
MDDDHETDSIGAISSIYTGSVATLMGCGLDEAIAGLKLTTCRKRIAASLALLTGHDRPTWP